MPEPTRRLFLRRALQFGVGLAVLPRAVPPARAVQSCVDPQSDSLRASLHYASVSAVPNQSCSGCGFFTADTAHEGCGNCVIMSGPVDASGRCDSWSARS
jgi:High potential iron-sulfur protein